MNRAMPLILLLGACASGSGAPDAAGTRSTGTSLAGVRCPPAGTIVTMSTGSRVRYEGASPDDPASCVTLTSNGTRQRWLAALLSLPSENEAAYRAGFAELFPLAVGRTATFRTESPERNTPNIRIPVSHRWEVTGEEVLSIEDQRRPAWRLHRTTRNLMANTTQEATIWLDKETGAPLAFSGTEETSGTSRARSYRATQIAVTGRR